MARTTKQGITVWFLVLPGTGMLNIAGPWEVFGHANDLLGRQAYQLELRGTRVPVVETRHGLLVGGLRALPRTGDRLPDVAIVAGGPMASLPFTAPGGGEAAPLVRWLRRFHARVPTVVSICTGAFVLAAAGVLDGRRATTHWMMLDELRARCPAAQVVDEGIFVEDRGVWTSAGITAGIDLALAMVERDHGHGVAMAVAKRLVLFLRRSGNQAQFSAALQRQEKEPPELRDISTFVLEHVGEALSVERLARGVAMSPRSLTRWCRQHLGESPAALVRRLRLDEARRLLEQTPLPLKDVAARTGLGDASTLWRLFTRHLGVPPAVYRDRFARQAVTAAA
jgi:transcriptional regulator GlxA family with amidase domain